MPASDQPGKDLQTGSSLGVSPEPDYVSMYTAVAHKPHAEGKLVDVPRVPACLAVHKKRRWWVKLLQILVATGGVAAAVGAAAITAAGVSHRMLVIVFH